MNKLRLFLFGKFRAQYGNCSIHAFDGQKVQALFCHLLLFQDRPHSREVLANLLWDNVTPTQSKGYLRKALWQIQRELSKYEQDTNGTILQIDSEWVQINPEADFWLDVTEFENMFTVVKDIPGWQLEPVVVHQLRKTVDLFHGDLLECSYQDYCLLERTRLRHMYLIMLDKLMDYCTVNNAFEEGLIYGLQILRYDQARECTHRRLMRLHYLANNRTEALRQYQQCAAILQKELGVNPTKRTIELYKQIQADQLETLPSALFSLQTKSSGTVYPLHESLKNLQKLQQELWHVQAEIQHGIQVAETLLNNI